MSKWKQISGDVSWDSTGCVLAMDRKKYRQVELVKIEPWLELDPSALRDDSDFWCVDTKTVDYKSMGTDRKNVLEAIKSIGMDVAEYKRLEPVYKAEIVASYEGYDDSQSTSDLLDALPDKPENIEFWHGKETKASVLAHNDEMRRDVVHRLAGYRRRGEVPSYDLLKLAMGNKPFKMSIDKDHILGYRYAELMTNLGFSLDELGDAERTGVLDIPEPESLEIILKKLYRAPASSGLNQNERDALVPFFDVPLIGTYDDRVEMLMDKADDASEQAIRLADDILEELGF